MRTKHFLFATLLAVILTGCYDDDKLWDAVNQQTARIEALESWQKETNSNIQALQTLVSTQDYITQVTPVTLDGDTVGYTIAFKNNKPISIYHGQKGDKGEQGIAGTVPTISATQEADGNWYWTLNGTLMKDASGNPVRANGQTGTAAPTPLLKTGKELTSQGTSGNWISDAAYLSVDNGTSWTKVSGDDGQDGSNGSNGDSMFSKVTTFENEGYVAFQLAGGGLFEVPIYRALTLKFTYQPFDKNVTLDPNDAIKLLDSKTTITYNIEGTGINKENVKVLPIISGNDWSFTLDSKAKTLTFTLPSTSPADSATLSFTATDNAGQSCSYILNLKKSFGEKGNEDDPYTISTPYELAYIAQKVNDGTEYYNGDYFELSNDIDLTEIEWIPIGRNEQVKSFQGTFDGKGHTIRGLKAVEQEVEPAGLFGKTENATLKNISLISPEVKTENGFCGSLAGAIENTTIKNCYVTDGICSTEKSDVGGLIGLAADKNTIINCHAKNTTVTGADNPVGGLIGRVDAGENACNVTKCSVTECELNVTATGTDIYCGGLIGLFVATTLELTACYATGSINSPNGYVGGLLGAEKWGRIDRPSVTMTGCYSKIIDQNGVASFTLQGFNSSKGISTFTACYYITTQTGQTEIMGITYQDEITLEMIARMNEVCGNVYDSKGTLISASFP